MGRCNNFQDIINYHYFALARIFNYLQWDYQFDNNFESISSILPLAN